MTDIDALHNALTDVHREVRERSDEGRRRAVEAHNRRTGVKKVDFSVRDFVLVRTTPPRRHKLTFKWHGLHQVTRAISPLLFEFKSLVTEKLQTFHAHRLRTYCEAYQDTTVTPEMLKISEHPEADYQDFERFCGIRMRENEVELRVEWRGLPEKVDETWEPIQMALEDLPLQLEEYMRSPGDRKVKTDALRRCSLPP